MGYTIEQDFVVPDVPTSEDYGRNWPIQASQLVKELKMFKVSRETGDLNAVYIHGLNIVRMLWPDRVEIVKQYNNPKTGEKKKIFNNYFLKVFRRLCEKKSLGLTGCASSSKTFTTSVYSLVCFYAYPTDTTVLISTTSGTASERRIWGDVKELHRMAKFKENDMPVIGQIVEYLKSLTFDYEKSMGDNATQRDLRNGVSVVPISNDSSGEKAVETIIGTKNNWVIWIVDEAPNMMDNVLRPRSNLIANPYFQLVVIGNANRKSDPHGLFCEPVDGWDSIDFRYDTEWEARTGYVVFLHGLKSPNYLEGVFQSTEESSVYPFPYLSNRFYEEEQAKINGNGDSERGRKTLDYMRFAIGFWLGDETARTVLSPEFVMENNAHLDPKPWDWRGPTNFASLDPGWSYDGDNNALSIASVGEDYEGHSQLVVKTETIHPEVIGEDRESFRRALAAAVVSSLERGKVEPKNFSVDASGDGGLVAQAIIQEWAKRLPVPEEANKIKMLSSLEKASDPDRYDDKVTEFWFQVPLAVASGALRGFKLDSDYAKDLFSRLFESVGKGKVRVERKKDMKKRIKRSPDHGDSWAYVMHQVNNSGLLRFRTPKQKNRPAALREDSRAAQRFQSTEQYEDTVSGDVYMELA